MSSFGILNIQKPRGPTSRDVVNRAERLARPCKCGHAGTLDPLASGVVVVCLGPATRLIQYVQQMRKHYRATFLLGRRSPTDDVEQESILLENAPRPSRAQVEAALPAFLGQIQQRPPEYSAVKIAGRRAYQLARAGKAVELMPRTVTIYELRVLAYEYPELELDIQCGSGTYIRALGRDLAESLGTSSVMSSLERTAIGPYRVEDAIPFDTLSASDIQAQLQPPLTAVANLPRVELSSRDLAEIHHGRPIDRPATGAADASPTAQWAAIEPSGRLAAILYEKRAGQLWPAINFHL